MANPVEEIDAAIRELTALSETHGDDTSAIADQLARLAFAKHALT